MTKVNFTYKGKYEAPKIQSQGAAGLDLFNNSDNSVVINPEESKIIGTGFSVEIPEGYVGLVFARSSLGFKFDCTLANSVGVIDSDYRGEVKVKIANHSKNEKIIEPNERIAQLVIMPYLVAEYNQVETLSETERGESGFGSTGEV